MAASYLELKLSVHISLPTLYIRCSGSIFRVEVKTADNSFNYQPYRLMNEAIYFDDLTKGDVFTFGPYHVEHGEMLAFSRKWDPLPIHLDKDAAVGRGHLGIIASGQFTLCVKQKLMTQAPWRDALIGAMGFDELRFPRPVYAGDDLSLKIECIDTRPSRSKADRGIVKMQFQITNQHNESVLDYVDTVMFTKRSDNVDAATASSQAQASVPESQALALAENLIVMKRGGVETSARIGYVASQLNVATEAAEQIHMDFEAGFASGTNMALGMPPSRKHVPADEAFHAIASQLGVSDMQAMMDAEQEQKAQRKRRTTLVAAGICIAGVALVAALFFMG